MEIETPKPAPLWRRFVQSIFMIFSAFALIISVAVLIWLVVFFGSLYLFSWSDWRGSAAFATFFGGLALLQLTGEAVVGGIFAGIWWALTFLWRRSRAALTRRRDNLSSPPKK